MPTVRGKEEVARFVASLPEQFEKKLLRGAGRAAVNVIKAEAKARSVSDEVAAAVKTSVRTSDGRIVAKVLVKGPGDYKAPWLEYGTDPHFISVSDAQRGGKGVKRINAQVREAGGDASLVIGGNFAGETVFHPGARPHPFLRPALDIKGDDAVRAAQAYINARVSKAGVTGSEENEGIEA